MTQLLETVTERINTGRLLIEQGLTLVPYRFQSKAPHYLAPDRPGWSGNDDDLHRRAEVDTVELWEQWVEFAPNLNISVMTVAQVDADSDEAIALAKELGVSSSEAVWIIHTRRGYRALYRPPTDVQVWNQVKAGGVDLDLLLNSPAVVPPSVHPKGHLYRWAPGNSPAEIPFKDLGEPPQLLTEWWSNKCHQTERWNDQHNHRPLDQPKGFVDTIRATIQANAMRQLRENANGDVITNCPFPQNHKRGDRSESFSINFQMQVFNCFGCNTSGSFRTLADQLGIPVDRVDRRPSGRVRVTNYDK